MIIAALVWIGLAVVAAFGVARAVRIAEQRRPRATPEDTNDDGEGERLHLVVRVD